MRRLVPGRRRLGREAGGHQVSEVPEVVVDLDLHPGETGGVLRQSLLPPLLSDLGLLAKGPEEIVLGRQLRTGFGLEAHLHG
jgi:hypothetical protein